jgi:hypothetical protein
MSAAVILICMIYAGALSLAAVTIGSQSYVGSVSNERIWTPAGRGYNLLPVCIGTGGMMTPDLRLPTTPNRREGLFASRPAIYISVIIFAVFVAYAYKLRSDTILSCPAYGYNTDRYVAYCSGARYADYEHGALMFDLEPSVQSFARNADLLFLGNSRLQVAFSTDATADWFAAASARYYLLGFQYNENVIFAEEALRRIRPRAKVYVINVDDFFERYETPPVKTIFNDPNAQSKYQGKRLWQRFHEPICKTFAALCGNHFVVFRSRKTGAYTKDTFGKDSQKLTVVSYDEVINQDVVSRSTAAAIDFLSHLTVERKCIILTNVPTGKTKIGNINAIATALGVDLVPPGILPGLYIADGDHLDGPSAERWSQAFFKAAGSRIRSCLEDQGVTHVESSYQSLAQ